MLQSISSSNVLVSLKSCENRLTKVVKIQDLSRSFWELIERESSKKSILGNIEPSNIGK